MSLLKLEKAVANSEAFADYRKMKHRIDGWRVLEHYGAKNIQLETDSGEVVHSCIVDQAHPHHKNQDQNPSASLNVKTGLWSCWAYRDDAGRSGGDYLWLVQQIEGCGPGDAITILRDLLLDDDSVWDRERQEWEAMAEPPKKQSNEIRTYPLATLDHWLVPHPYWGSRGFTEETIKQFSLGYDEQEVRLVIPVFLDGKLIGWQKRTQNNPEWPMTTTDVRHKYKNSYGFPKSRVLFGWDQAIEDDGHVIVVEGPLDAITLVQAGYNAVATFSAEIGAEQLARLRYWNSVIFFPDMDPAGLKYLKSLERLSEYTKTSLIIPEPGEDANSVTSDRLDELVDSRQDGLKVLLELAM